MRRRAMRFVVCALAAAVIASGCAEVPGPSPRATVPPSPAAWENIAGSIDGPWDGDSPNVCKRGERACLDAVIAEMNRRLDVLAAACDRRSAFLLMYLRVTDRVRADGDRLFDDRRYLNHFDSVFAQLYFKAFDDWQAGRRGDVPDAWRIAFRASEDAAVSALGDMLLGMNAHISRDLPYTLESIGLETPDGDSARADFDRVNEILVAVQGPMLAEVARRFDPTVLSVRPPMLNAEPLDVGEVLGVWRTDAYQDAEDLIAAAESPVERGQVVARIEKKSADRANLIRTLTSYRLAGGSASDRDDHCRAHG